MELWPVILAGGSGTRLWPLSREEFPKQLLTLKGSGSLLQETVLRSALAQPGPAAGEPELAPPLVVCNEEHRHLILEQLRAVGQPRARLVLEPVGRNTAPALTVAALLAGREGKDPVLLVLPADHYVADVAAYRQAVAQAVRLAELGGIGTLGVVPTQPETGYGYIRSGDSIAGDARAVLAFEEKPDAERARRFVASGDYFWNSGIFVTRASVWLDALRVCRADILDACTAAEAGASWDGAFLRLVPRAFEACPGESIDYAVMEPITRSLGEDAGPEVFVVPLAAGWSDIGSWNALLELGGGDDAGNVTQGDVHLEASRNTLVLAQHRLVATLGLEGMIVVETPDAVLVAQRESSQDVRKVVAWLAESGRGEGRTHRRVYRPWGSYETVDEGPRFEVKRLTIRPGRGLSRQRHHHRTEHWVVVSGMARVRRGDESFLLAENESTFVPVGVEHTLENPGQVDLEVVEVRSGGYLGEDDIERIENT